MNQRKSIRTLLWLIAIILTIPTSFAWNRYQADLIYESPPAMQGLGSLVVQDSILYIHASGGLFVQKLMPDSTLEAHGYVRSTEPLDGFYISDTLALLSKRNVGSLLLSVADPLNPVVLKERIYLKNACFLGEDNIVLNYQDHIHLISVMDYLNDVAPVLVADLDANIEMQCSEDSLYATLLEDDTIQVFRLCPDGEFEAAPPFSDPLVENIRMVNIKGAVVYALVENGLHAIDYSTFDDPQRIGYARGGTSPQYFNLGDNYALIQNIARILIVDISDPDNLELVGDIPTTFARRFALTDDFAILTGSEYNDPFQYAAIKIYSIADLGNPQLIHEQSSRACIWDVDVQGDRLYAVDDGVGLHTYDISNPSSPVLLNTFEGISVARFKIDVAGDFIGIIGLHDPNHTLQISVDLFEIDENDSLSLLGVVMLPEEVSFQFDFDLDSDRLYTWADSGRINCYQLLHGDEPQFTSSIEVGESGGFTTAFSVSDHKLIVLEEEGEEIWLYNYDVADLNSPIFIDGLQLDPLGIPIHRGHKLDEANDRILVKTLDGYQSAYIFSQDEEGLFQYEGYGQHGNIHEEEFLEFVEADLSSDGLSAAYSYSNQVTLLDMETAEGFPTTIDLPDECYGLCYENGYLYEAHTIGFGIYQVTAEWVSAPEKEVLLLPQTASISAIYPNPFNQQGRILYQLPQAEQVRISLFNMVGQRVTVLLDQHQVAGEHSVSWNAQNLASGVYICRLETDQAISAKRVVLLK